MSNFFTLRSMLLIATAAFVFAHHSAGAASEASSPGDVFQLTAGKWAWSNIPDQCSENPHYITFSPDRKTAQFRVDKPFQIDEKMVSEYSYTILSSEERSITMVMDGETRRTDSGDRVVWVLILKNPTTYAWRRTDWEPSRLTPDVARCN